MVTEKLVLLVDADIDVREGLSELLQAKGYTVLQAESGRKALDS
jgi:CheY-like chemotaxis protein